VSHPIPRFQVGEVVIATNLRSEALLTINKASTYLVLKTAYNEDLGMFDLFLEDDEGLRHQAPESCFMLPEWIIK